MRVMKLTAALLDDYELLVAKGSKEPKSFQIQDALAVGGPSELGTWRGRHSSAVKTSPPSSVRSAMVLMWFMVWYNTYHSTYRDSTNYKGKYFYHTPMYHAEKTHTFSF